MSGAAPPVPAERIDAHQHFWRLERGDYGWLMPGLGRLYRDYGPADLVPELARCGIARTVLVQAAPTEAETRYLLGLARASGGRVAGVVGWVDMAARDAPARIEALARDSLLVGVRPMLQDLPDPEWILRPELAPALAAIERCGLAFDALVRPPHLAALARLVARRPMLHVVIDHGAKPDIARGDFAPWAAAMAALARDSQAWVKLSGLVTEAGAAWREADLAPYVDHLLTSFGPARMIWGSDWPVLLGAASYARWVAASDRLLAGLDAVGRAGILGGNARRFYRLAEAPGPEP